MTVFMTKGPISPLFWATQLVNWQVNHLAYRQEEDFDKVAQGLKTVTQGKKGGGNWTELSLTLHALSDLIKNPGLYVRQEDETLFTEGVKTQIEECAKRLTQLSSAERQRLILISKTI